MPRTMTAEREAFYRRVLAHSDPSPMVKEGWAEIDAERAAHEQTTQAAEKLAEALSRHLVVHNCCPNGHIERVECSCDNCYKLDAALAQYAKLKEGK